MRIRRSGCSPVNVCLSVSVRKSLLLLACVGFLVVVASQAARRLRELNWEAKEPWLRHAMWHVDRNLPDHDHRRLVWGTVGNLVGCYTRSLCGARNVMAGARDHRNFSSSAGSDSSSGSGSGSGSGSRTCPSYFRWIQEDLVPWRDRGIFERDLLGASGMASFRVVISRGRLYAEYYEMCFQTRGMFTLWALLLLLERYSGEVPDVDLMFHCSDIPQVMKERFQDGRQPPPLFSYCSTNAHWDIPFPDWSFWGWPETNIAPWEHEAPAIAGEAGKVAWEDLSRFAFWKGNPYVAEIRQKLLLCNASVNADSKAHVYVQDWLKESKTGYSTSDLAKHCNHRFNIYAPGNAWSVSYKYIMTCGAPVLAIESEYYEFFTRSLIPNKHFLPADPSQLCSSIDSQVKWGNSNPSKAEAIGKRGQSFMLQELSLDNVYDYMLHLLKEYSMLLKYVPSVPPGAEEVCREKLLCVAGKSRRPMMSRNTIPSHFRRPCAMQS